MDTLMGLMMGIGLSAACGFRVFVPLLGMSIATMSGHLSLAQEFQWIGSWPALVTFGAATILEIAAYYIPWIDNLMDSVATPAATIAGTVTTASMGSDLSPLLHWALALVAGGGVATAVQGGTVALRAKSTGITQGSTNFVVSTGELAGSIFMTILAIVFPVACFVVVVWICYKLIRMLTQFPIFRRKPA